MIISASRRTDIPAFYTAWFMRRIQEGYCEVPNPFHAGKSSVISLLPQDVDCIVFWTRNPRPLLPHLDTLEDMGYRFYFQVSLLGYDALLDPRAPEKETALESLRALARRIGTDRVVWRYDPIVFSNRTDVAYHRSRFAELAQALAGSTVRVTVSILDDYRKARARLNALASRGLEITWEEDALRENATALYPSLAQIAADNGMQIFTCAETIDVRPFGITPGACVDAALIERLFGLSLASGKDPYQRPACGCAVSRDIGVYNTCLYGCRYCYATRTEEEARRNFAAHDPDDPALLHPRRRLIRQETINPS